MGDRVSVQFKSVMPDMLSGKPEEDASPVLFGHWGGMRLVQWAEEYAEGLIGETGDEMTMPLDRLEPRAVLLDFIERKLIQPGRKLTDRGYYLGRTVLDGDNSDNGHWIIEFSLDKRKHKNYRIYDAKGRAYNRDDYQRNPRGHENPRWVKKWEVPSSTGRGSWIVAQDEQGNYGCSCPIWKFQRKECKHIAEIKATGGRNAAVKERPEYVLAKVYKPTYDAASNRLLVPLVPFGAEGVHMEATICWAMLRYGWSWAEIQKIRLLPREWTVQAVKDYIDDHGEAEWPKDYYPAPERRAPAMARNSRKRRR